MVGQHKFTQLPTTHRGSTWLGFWLLWIQSESPQIVQDLHFLTPATVSIFISGLCILPLYSNCLFPSSYNKQKWQMFLQCPHLLLSCLFPILPPAVCPLPSVAKHQDPSLTQLYKDSLCHPLMCWSYCEFSELFKLVHPFFFHPALFTCTSFDLLGELPTI